jgi:hypothetical protein
VTEQSLPFRRTVDAAEALAPAVRRVLEDGQWHTAKALRAVIGIGDRELRLVAERSRGTILGSQLGYKLTRFATVEEVDHVERWLQSQSRKMTHRAVEIRRARNGMTT